MSSSEFFVPLRDAAQTLGLDLSDVQLQQLLDYLGLIQKWNKVYNLTAVRDPQAMLVQHLVDSLSLIPALRRHLAATPGQRLMMWAAAAVCPGWSWPSASQGWMSAAWMRSPRRPASSSKWPPNCA